MTSRLALAAMGWDVCCTDVEPVLSSVLRPNIVSNGQGVDVGVGRGRDGDGNEADGEEAPLLQCKELDWTVEPELWTWTEDDYIASHDHGRRAECVQHDLEGEVKEVEAAADAEVRICYSRTESTYQHIEE
jgi:hypothetical protein